jgi:hypothetical protein
MAKAREWQPGQRARVIDPDDGYYLQEGVVEEVRGGKVWVRFGADDSQPFRPTQIRPALDEPA